MIKREKALELAKRAGMDEKQFFDLLSKEENYTREMLDENWTISVVVSVICRTLAVRRRPQTKSAKDTKDVP